jgi:hypothetical protein
LLRPVISHYRIPTWGYKINDNGDLYYEYVVVYVDDILVVTEKPKQAMNCLAKQYLGAQIMEHHFPEEPQFLAWAMSSAKYVKEAVRLVEQELLEIDKRFPSKVSARVST